MKVLYVIDGLGTGGAERSLAEMLPTLEPAGVRAIVACLHHRTEGVEREVIERGADVRFVGQGAGTWVREIHRLVRSERPDLVHTTIFSANVSGRLASIGTGVPVLTSLVNTPYVPARLTDPGVRRWSLAAVRAVDLVTSRAWTDHFHAITRAVKDWAVADLGLDPRRVTVIERGRDPERLGGPDPERRRRARQSLGLTDADEVVVTVGRQEHQKGQRYLVEAIRRLAESRPRLVLLLAGRLGASSDELQRMSALPELDGRIRLLGHRPDVPELLAAADVFAFPSLYEGLGGATIEAMALGLPIVASRIAAVEEILEDGRNAILVPPGSATDLASETGRLLEDGERRRAFGLRSREIFLERHTLEHSSSRMIELYRRLVSRGRRSIGNVA